MYSEQLLINGTALYQSIGYKICLFSDAIATEMLLSQFSPATFPQLGMICKGPHWSHWDHLNLSL